MMHQYYYGKENENRPYYIFFSETLWFGEKEMDKARNRRTRVVDNEAPSMILAIGAFMDGIYRNDFEAIKTSANLMWQSMAEEPGNPYDGSSRSVYQDMPDNDDWVGTHQDWIGRKSSYDGMSVRSGGESLKSAMKKKGSNQRSGYKMKLRFGDDEDDDDDDVSMGSTIVTRQSLMLEDQQQLEQGLFADDDTIATWDDNVSLLKRIKTRHVNIAFASKQKDKHGVSPNTTKKQVKSSKRIQKKQGKGKWKPDTNLSSLAEEKKDDREDEPSTTAGIFFRQRSFFRGRSFTRGRSLSVASVRSKKSQLETRSIRSRKSRLSGSSLGNSSRRSKRVPAGESSSRSKSVAAGEPRVMKKVSVGMKSTRSTRSYSSRSRSKAPHSPHDSLAAE